ncbi:hypothetical protein HZA43_03955 [Candidatus Peregrinibacteria bacterium]|nr:hypothetical protein [Candidatus Peregrinibacteria bacterium]
MNHLSHPYRHFDPVARFVYLNNPQQIAATIETAKPGEITTAVTADNLKAAIDKAQTAIKKGSEDLAKTLGRDATTGREKDALNALNALEKESAAKFRELIDAHGVAVSDASADKQTKLETVKGNLDAAISALVTKIHATTDEGANDELDDAQKKIAYTVLVNQIPEFGKKSPLKALPNTKPSWLL